MSLFIVALSEGSEVMGIQCWISALSFLCRDFSGSSKSFNDYMNCGEINTFLITVHWEMFWLFSHTYFHKWWTFPHSWLWMTEAFKDAPFIPNYDTINCYQWTDAFWASHSFQSCCCCPNFIGMCCKHPRWVYIYIYT